jgi:GNAT superfamily N-acetyltransferase
VRIGPDDVGRRVVLRHRLPDGRATDVLGELVAWDASAGFARVVTLTGEVTVPLGDLLMGKPIPPPPAPRRPRPPRLSVPHLHDVMADGWQPVEREDYGGWRLRAAEGFTGRANSVLPLGPPPAPLPEAIGRVEDWYAARSLPARFCVPWPLGSGPGEPAYGTDPLETELATRGYLLDYPTLVLTRSVVGAETGPEPTPGLVLDLRAEPDDAWLALYHYRGQDLPPIAVRVLMSAPAQAFASLRTPEGEAVAIGRVASARGWAGIAAVEVAPGWRRRGLAQVVMAALLAWGREQGDHSAYLQVARDNTAGRALYDRLGFTAHSGYHYRIQPA